MPCEQPQFIYRGLMAYRPASPLHQRSHRPRRLALLTFTSPTAPGLVMTADATPAATAPPPPPPKLPVFHQRRAYRQGAREASAGSRRRPFHAERKRRCRRLRAGRAKYRLPSSHADFRRVYVGTHRGDQRHEIYDLQQYARLSRGWSRSYRPPLGEIGRFERSCAMHDSRAGRAMIAASSAMPSLMLLSRSAFS